MLKLPYVTLVAIDTVCHRLTDMAVAECTEKVEFGDVKVFMNRLRADNIYIDEFKGAKDAWEFALYKLPYQVKTDFILFIQWDSWVLNPDLWSDEFLCDYIGAPWWYKDGLNVGNSGFCIRSKRLMQFLAEHRDEFPPQQPEDSTLCRKYRPRLSQFKWADEQLARQFSFERVRPAIDSRHFGFHGVFNWPFVLTPTKLAERLKIARDNAYIQKTGSLKELDIIFSERWLPATGV